MNPINANWTKPDGNHDGGTSTGIGFTIAWQRGPLKEAGRNGAFLIEVLEACQSQLEYFESANPELASEENQTALYGLRTAIAALNSRRNRRKANGTLGTTQPD